MYQPIERFWLFFENRNVIRCCGGHLVSNQSPNLNINTVLPLAPNAHYSKKNFVDLFICSEDDLEKFQPFDSI